jgi:aldehyde dehydrogenase (NAD+)
MTTTVRSDAIQAPAPGTAESIPAVVARLRQTFASGRTKPLAWRLEQLRAVERMLGEREADFADALATDLGRPRVDAWLADLAPAAAEAAHTRKHLRRWMRPRRVPLPLSLQPGRASYQYEPLGVALIIGPWNYPVYLTIGPLVGAIGAGNCAVLKPSEHTPTVSQLLAKLVPEYLDAEAFAVVEGAAEQTQQLLDQAVDHAFFTGGPEIAKAVMAGAARHLTPVTLELGGKSPVIVAQDAAIKVAARRIAWTKLMNSGQTCIAPDYVLVERSVRDEFIGELKAAIAAFTPDGPKQLPLVNSRQAARIDALLSSSGGQHLLGGAVDVAAHRAEPTIVLDPDPDSPLLREEIFGPVLPLVTVDSLDQAIAFVKARPKPLALYLFSQSKVTQRRVLAEISNGATVINHLMFQVLANNLPFGGVGNSGMGAYHGEWGFQTFSHRKAVLRKPTRPDPSIIYPPYTPLKERLLRRLF